MNTRKRLCSFSMGLALVLVVLVIAVITAFVDGLNFGLGAIIVLGCLLAAWFTCSITKTLRRAGAER